MWTFQGCESKKRKIRVRVRNGDAVSRVFKRVHKHGDDVSRVFKRVQKHGDDVSRVFKRYVWSARIIFEACEARLS